MEGGQVGEGGDVCEAQFSCMGDSCLLDMEKIRSLQMKKGLLGEKSHPEKKLGR